MKKVEVISPKDRKKEKLKVAAYCRVSSEKDEQNLSLENQIKHFTDEIKQNDEWEFAGTFYDRGSGLRTENREGLNAMIKKASSGEIDLINIKSVMRLSRNTIDTLQILRNLKNRGIDVYFEVERMNSMNGEMDVNLTFVAALAQEESRNLSENIRWGQQRSLERGNMELANRKVYGYGVEDGKLIVLPREAEVVVQIYELYLEGNTLAQLKSYLEENMIKTPAGKDIWGTNYIQKILKNEKYIGDILFGKTYVDNFL